MPHWIIRALVQATSRRRPRPLPIRRRLAPFALTVLVVACSDLTKVIAPDVVQPSQLNNAAGADALSNAALAGFSAYVSIAAYNSGQMADEFFDAANPSGNGFDQRKMFPLIRGPVEFGLTRNQAIQAIAARRQYAPNPRSRIGQLFAALGMAEMFLGEMMCNGTPLSSVQNGVPIYGGPITADSISKRGLVDLDSALSFVTDSQRIVSYVQLARARVLQNLGRSALAAAAVTGIPTSFVFNAELTAATTTPAQTNLIFANNSTKNVTVADREGTNGLPFRSAGDPRLPTQLLGKGLDGTTDVYLFTKYSSLASPIVISSGIEARLIEAEAALNANQNDASPTGTGWLGILNTLRTTAIAPAMSALTDPGSYAARVDLLYRERAFWLYGTGHRLGDLRRLLKYYGRTQNATYPVGLYKGGQTYATDIVLTLGLSEQSNPLTNQCTNQNP